MAFPEIREAFLSHLSKNGISELSRWPHWLIVGVIALTLLGFAIALGASAKDEPGKAIKATPVDVIRVQESSNLRTSASYVGRVEARRKSALGFELGGKLARVLIDEGQTFRRGQTLARLDQQRLVARKRELEMHQNRARANANLRRQTFERFQAANDADAAAIAALELDEARFQMEAAEAEYQAITAQIAAVDVDIGRAKLVAPFPGVVLARNMDEGKIAAPGEAVLMVAETVRPEARIGVPGGTDSVLPVGHETTVKVDGQDYAAKVKSIVPARDSQTRTIDIILTLAASIGEIREGDLAEIEIARELDAKGYWVPLTALTESRRGLWAVYVVDSLDDKTGTLARREVELVTQNQAYAFVRGTLKHGDLVVASGLQRLAPDALVEPIKVETIEL